MAVVKEITYPSLLPHEATTCSNHHGDPSPQRHLLGIRSLPWRPNSAIIGIRIVQLPKGCA